MRLIVVGSSDAFNAAGRHHSCYWLEDAGTAPIMIDFGATALQGLKALSLDPRRLGAIAFTHLHGDHLGGLPFLLLDGMYGAVRTTPLSLLGPVMLEARARSVYTELYGEVATRARAYPVEWRELRAGLSTSLLGALVAGYPADHMDPPEEPLCLRVTGRDGRIAAFSGDTAFCDGLFAAADGADVLIAECSQMAPPAGRHCTWSEWLGAFARMRARRIVLTHLGADVRSRVDELRAIAPSNVSFAEDGMTIDI